jgi:capsid protein
MLALIMTLALGCTCCDVTPSGVAFAAEMPRNESNYDALNPKGKRKAPSAATQHEDRHLTQEPRRQLIGGMRDLRRNSSLLDWMIRQHLNYVCEHRFQSKSGDDGLDDEVEYAMKEEFSSTLLDERQIFGLPEYIQTSETMAVLDGDCGTLFIDGNEGGRIQGIEGDRIRDPIGSFSSAYAAAPAEIWYNGVRTTETGRPLEYAVHRRINGWTMFELERRVQAENFHLHAYRHRFDQQRGVSPVASAYNQLRDVYEAEDYAMVRSKVASMFAMAITRDASKSGGALSFETDESGNAKSNYQVDFGRGPIFLDMDLGEDAKFLDSDNPGGNLQDFWRFVTRVALKSLDIPYGLFDESESNFFGNKTAWLSYDRSCDPKRRNVRTLLDRITAFKYRGLLRSKRLTVPRTLIINRKPWAWVPRGMPWWRPLEEVTATLKAIGGGLTTPQRACIESDQGDFYENVDEIGKAIDYAEQARGGKGVPLSYAVDGDLVKQLTDANQRAAAGKGE